MADRLVCDIYFYLYLRLVFGFYHEFKRSKPVCWLVRCYCCFVAINIVIWGYILHNNTYPLFPMVLTILEYILYTLIAFWTNNEYLLRYYKTIPHIDDLTTNAYLQIRLNLIRYICILVTLKFISFLKYVASYWYLGTDRGIFAILEFTSWSTNVIGRLPILFVFSLLYVRVRFMRLTLESNDFQCRSHGKHHPRRFIQMYEAILDSLEESDGPVKVQLFVTVVFSMIFFSYESLYNLYFLDSSMDQIRTGINIIWFMLETLVRFSPLLLSAILLDIVYMEVQEMLVIVLKRRNDCKNERDRAEIQKLVQLLKDRPFQYSLWRIIPLNLRCVLSVLSYCITSVIAILQIKGWFK